MSGGASSGEPEPFGDLNFLRVTGRDRPAAPRLTPLTEAELDDEQRELLDATGLGRSNMLTTLVRHPGLFRRYNPFGGKLIRGRLDPRRRELVILRTTWLCGCDFLWESHVRAGMKAGLSQAEAERVSAGPDAPEWSALDRALLRAVDELQTDACITDGTWSVLAEALDEKELIEIPMLVGFYCLNCFSINSLGIPLDDELFGHPPERPTPDRAATTS